MDYTSLFGPPQDGQQPSPITNFSGTFGDTPPDVAAMAVPASSSAELEKRKAGWEEAVRLVTGNPNLMRALGMAGAALAQPKPLGQTTAGMLGNAYMVGQSAYTAGDYAEQNRKLAEREQTRREAATQSGIDTEAAARPGVAAKAAKEVGTVDTTIAAAKNALKQSDIALGAARDKAAIDKVESELKMRRALLERDIPDETLRKDIQAQYDSALAKVAQQRSTIAATDATTALTGARTQGETAEAGIKELTYQQLQKMGDAERKEFLTKTGRYSGHTSGISQQATMWGQIYDKLPADDPMKKGKTREQFQMEQLKAGKTADITTSLKNYTTAAAMANIDPDPEVLATYADLIKQSVGARAGKPAAAAGTTPAGAATGAPDANTKWTNHPDGKHRYTILPNGTIKLEDLAPKK